ncbi:MAG: diguanylate cyclase [Candidatus Avigastranaerophilus sp.]
MNIFSGLKDILGQINNIDGAIYAKGKDLADVYAKNIVLEEEIAARTKELEQANQTILTLNSVWDMMNSSQPLSSMLNKIVSILHNEMGYQFVAILKLHDENVEAPYFSAMSVSSHSNIEKIFNLMGLDIDNYKIPYVGNSIVAKAINEKQIYSTPDMDGVIGMFFPSLSKEQKDEFMKLIQSKIFSIVPLVSKQSDYKGCVIVTSERNDITDTESNFLTLYANQIELAIVVAKLFEEVQKQAITDPLTGLYNRRYFEDNVVKEAERSLRLKQPFSLISMDLDFLKKINDTYGHQYGDIAIKTIANVLKTEARSIDIPARIGGEEFSLMLPGVDSKGAYTAAERIRKSIESQELETIGGITASIGVATFLEHSDRIDELVEFADQAMYKAKINGRNQVQIAQRDCEINWQQVAVETFLDILVKKRIPVSDELAENMEEKLNAIKTVSKNSKDVLYTIVDMISQTYNQMYKAGTTKSKLLLAVMLAKRLDLPTEEIDKLRLAILLYDIGNIMISEEIFNKKEPLTEKERAIIKQHPIIAAREILKPISNIQDIIPIIESHHENWDGNGYPQHKSGMDIPITSQIVLLVDSFYAMTQDRPYRQAYTVDEVMEIIKEQAGKRWNEKLVEDFIYIIKNEPSR